TTQGEAYAAQEGEIAQGDQLEHPQADQGRGAAAAASGGDSVEARGQEPGASQEVSQEADTAPAGAQQSTEVQDGLQEGRQEAQVSDPARGEPALVYRSDGSPFKTAQAARLAAKNRRLQGYEPVQVDGGWALAPVDQNRGESEQQASSPVIDEQPATQTQTEETEEKTAVTEPSDGVVPHFETYDDANDWIERRAKELGISRRAFGSTDEYKAIYPQIEALYQAQKAKTAEQRMAALRDAGLAVGDRVKTTVMGMFLNAEDYYGTIVLWGGEPWVKVDGKITVSKKGRLYEASRVRWTPRWKKVTATDAEPQ